MSAFVVDRDHIVYLVEAGATIPRYGDGLRWWWNEASHHLNFGDTEEMVRVANMLWQENIKSVSYRYGSRGVDDLPGPIGENYKLTPKDFRVKFGTFDLYQIIQSCHCYDYQTCEHPDYKKSEAYAFISSLEGEAVRKLPGMEKTIWGAPTRKVLA